MTQGGGAPAQEAAGAPAAQEWPTPAPLGRTPDASSAPPSPAASARPEPPVAQQGQTQGSPGGIDAAALRSAWDTVLAAVKTRKRTAHAQLLDATVASVEGATLVLAFQHAPILRQFQAGTGPDVLKEALQAALGAALALRCVLHDSLAPHDPAARSAPVAAAPAPPQESGFAPGDEAVPEDPDAPPPAESGARAGDREEAALRLVETELGGKVMSTSDDA